MAQVKLIVVEHNKHVDINYFFKTRVRTAKGLLNKARELALEYSSYYFFKWHKADVYIYDPTKEKEDYSEKNKVWYLNILDLFDLAEYEGRDGYNDLSLKVEEVQGIYLKV